jgi:hypothetical protein
MGAGNRSGTKGNPGPVGANSPVVRSSRITSATMGLEFPPGCRPPWLNERGKVLPEKLPLDSALARAISGDKAECRDAVRLLGVMQHSGRVETGIYLMGLAGALDDWKWRTAIVEALHGFYIEGCAPTVLRVARRERLQHHATLSRRSAGDADVASGRIDACRLRGEAGRPNLFAAHARQGPLHLGWRRWLAELADELLSSVGTNWLRRSVGNHPSCSPVPTHTIFPDACALNGRKHGTGIIHITAVAKINRPPGP